MPRTPQRRLPIWAVVVAGGAVASISLGVRSTFGVFLDPIAETVGSGRGAIALAVAIQNLLWGLTQPLAGAVSDRFGAARTIALGIVLWCASMLLLSTATTPGMVLVSGGFLAGLAVGAASFSVILSSIGRMVPAEKRTLTLGVVSAVGSLGQFVLVPLAQSRIDATSWQTTAVILAIIALTAIVFTPALRGKAADFPDLSAPHAAPRTLGQEFKRATSNRSFQYLNAAFFVCGFHVTFIGVHLPAYVGDLGQPTSSGSRALALIGLFNVVGSLAAGVLGSRYSNTRLLAGIYGLRAVVISVFVLVPASTTTTLLFGVAIGTLWLATVPLTGAIVSKQFGTAHSGALFGLVFLSHQIGSFIGAYVGGEVVDRVGSYDLMWWTAVVLGIAATGMHLMIDESPVLDDDVPPQSKVRLAPAAIVVVLGLGIFSAVMHPAVTEAAEGPLPLYCHLG